MSTASTARRRSVSLRARLATRARPRIEYPLLVEQDGHAAATAALEEALQAWRQVVLRDDPDPQELAAVQAAVDAAQADLDGCYERIVLRALPPPEYEALIAAHPPTAEQRGEDPPQIWNPTTFRPALLALCVESDMSAEDWADFLDQRCSAAERQGLYVAALAVNEQERIAEPLALPKGLTRMRS